MLGSNVEKYGADVIPRMAAIGCELGNHSYAHPNMKELSLDDGLAQFQMTDELIGRLEWLDENIEVLKQYCHESAVKKFNH